MRVQNANLAPLDVKDPSRRKQTQSIPSSGDDVHLSELVRSLRSLVADSPERQQRIEQIARAYAQGAYEMDAEATAGKLIDDGLKYR
ncbi:MAG TPA: flagellar biosynthesis anti-sigma factor FlgM [Bryobacteraceae bacterium]|nr:flagellar biosynthesis anti-sigma factor FlgM [Bryobacteraceae bacterium]